MFRDKQVLGITTIRPKPNPFARIAKLFIALTAKFTLSTSPGTVNSNHVTLFKTCDVGTDFFDGTGNVVSRYHRHLGPRAFSLDQADI